MEEYMCSVLLTSALLSCVYVSDAHVRFLNPVSRSSLWRRYPTEARERNYDDNQLFCGGYAVIDRLLINIYFEKQIKSQYLILPLIGNGTL